MGPAYDLERFLAAQERSYGDALAEIRSGAKRSHWMWFIFPQIAGLGQSQISQFYAVRSLDEARAYLAHPVLGSRLRECLAALDGLGPTTAQAVFGVVDAIKLRSCLTLFHAAGGGPAFADALQRWFGREQDPHTLHLLAGTGG